MEKNVVKHKYTDKMSEMQVLACLIKDPLLFSDVNKYRFDIDDFSDQFHRILFAAVENLSISGAQKISYIDIDQFLKNYPTQYKVFTDNQGADYIIDLEEMVEFSNLDYYYNRLKKISLLNDFANKGFDVTPLYNDQILDPVRLSDMQKDFDKMTINDIILYFESQITQIKEKFVVSYGTQQCLAGDGLDELLEGFKIAPVMGLPFPSAKLTTIFRGMLLGKFLMISAPSGTGKSRVQGEMSARIAVGEYYDLNTNKWVKTGIHEPVLYISIELERDELQTIWVATISGVSESRIIDGKWNKEEDERIEHAKKLIKQAKLYFVRLDDYNVEDVENMIKKYYQLYQTQYVFFDYLSTSLKIMTEAANKTKMKGLREDQVLYMFATRLKELCNRIKIFILTSTQVSGSWRDIKVADNQLLRGSKAMADKIDGGGVLLPIREADKPIIAAHVAKGFELEPTHVIHIFKVRRGRFNNIRLYIHFDGAICRMTDCFATNNDGEIIDIADTNVEIILDQTSEDSNVKNPMITSDEEYNDQFASLDDDEGDSEPILNNEPASKIQEFDGFNF